MRKQGCFDCSRRALLGAIGASALLAALRPLPIFAQVSYGSPSEMPRIKPPRNLS